MKTNKTAILVTAFLGLALLVSVSCKRDSVTQPSTPIGPSSIAVMIDVEATPNVITAGVTQRQTTNVMATLKSFDGKGLANRTVLFEVVDAALNRLNIGFFEGNTSVFSRNTDSSGNAHVYYYGPLADELTKDESVYVRATVAWEGSQFINDTAQIFLVRDSNDLSLDVKAVPDLLFAGNTGGTSVIVATVFAGGRPVSNFPVFFVLGMALGKFGDGKVSTTSNTNDQGVATMTYLGPTAAQMPGSSETVPIFVQVSEQLGKTVNILIVQQK